MKIRLASPEDAPALAAIYAPYVRNTAVTFEYEAPEPGEFRERIRTTLQRYPYLAAVENGAVIGYAYAGAFHPRAAFRHAAEVSIYLDGNCRRRGVGRRLYTELEKLLRRQNVFVAYACIARAESPEDPYLTEDSIRFHESMNYTAVGIHRQSGYKFGRWYSVIWMEKSLRDRIAQPPDFIPFPQLFASSE